MNEQYKKLLVLIFLFVCVGVSQAQINVSIPSAQGEKGDTVQVLVQTSNVPVADEVIAIQSTMAFDPSILNLISVVKEGTILNEDWNLLFNIDNTNGSVVFGTHSTSFLSGAGSIVVLNFEVVGNPGESSLLTFLDFIYNAGSPAVNSTGGIFTVNGTSSQNGTYLQRVNAGGAFYTGVDGREWSGDQEYLLGSWGYFGGRSYSRIDPISGTNDDVLYQSERYGMSAYRFTVPNAGEYQVELHFAEIYYTTPGNRVFDVSLEGSLVIDDLDVNSLAGHDGALVRSFTVEVTDGILDVGFINIIDNPKVSAIQVAAVGPPPVISQLVFTTPSRVALTNQVSEVLTVQTQDSTGSPVNVDANTTIDLTTSSVTGEFSLTADPFVSVNTIEIASGNSTASFYYRDSSSGNPSIGASENPDQGWTDAVQQQTINVPPPPPEITGFNPTEGPVGTEVTINGDNFTGATQVNFNGIVSNDFTVDSDAVIRADVPLGASTGPIQVVTPFGNAASVVNFEVTAPALVQRVNAGGAFYTGVDGREWSADQEYFPGSWGFDGGRSYSRTDPITGTDDDVLYQSEHYGMTAYRFTIPNAGEYQVELHFAEIYYTTPGNRVFDVSLEGSLVIDDLDVNSLAGHDGALVRSFTVEVTDGILDVGFINIIDNPKVSAIQVTSLGPPPPPPVISQLVFTTPSRVALTNQVSEVLTVQTQDSTGSPVNVDANTTIDLTTSSVTGEFSLTADPFVSVNTVEIASGNSTASFYYRDSSSGNPSIGASENPDQGWTDAVQQQTINVPPPPPEITGFNPTEGPVGTEVTINGDNFTGATQVNFNGIVSNDFTVDSDAVIRADVPLGASTGPIQVVTPFGNAASVANFEVTAPALVQRVNAGGAFYTGVDGREWSADQEYFPGSWGFDGGRSYSRTDPITGTDDDVLYQSEHYGMTAYRFTIPNAGEYQVELHFAEIYYTTPGNRVFDVSLEGSLVIDDLDVNSLAGHDGALVRSFTVEVTDGILDVGFINIIDNPKVSAIQVTSLGPPPPPPVISQLVFTTPSRVALTNQVSEVLTVQTQDSTGSPVNVDANTTIDLTTSSVTGEFSLSADPFVSVSSVEIATGNSTASFYYRDSSSGNPSIGASENPDQGWTDAVQQQTINVPPPPPEITGFNPTEGPVGTEVTINGDNFTGATQVSFNGIVSNDFTVDSDAVIRADVPLGASTGPIQVVTPFGNAASVANFEVTTPAIIPYTQRVNAGGELYVGVDGREWSADQEYFPGSWGYDGGRAFLTSDPISGTQDDVLYQAERYGMDAYRFTVPNIGSYRVELHFAEIYYTAPGNRIFDLSIEGSLLVDDLDMVGSAGHDGALVRTFTVEVTDGVLDVIFGRVLDNPKISAIEVISIGPPISKLAIITPPNDVVIDRVSGLITVQAQIADGTPATVNVNTSLDLSSTSVTGEFSLSADPFVAVNSVVIPSGNNSASFYYRDSTLGTPTINVSENPDEGWTDAIQQQSIVPPPPPPAITGFTPIEGSVGTEVTIRGERFTGVTQVTFNGVLAVGFTVDSDTVARAFVPVDASTGQIGIVNVDGLGLSAGNFEVTSYIQRVNAGGSAQTGVDGREWEADQEYLLGSWGYESGTIFIRDFEIANTEDDTLYERARFGMSAYRFTVPVAEYRVELHFAETFYTSPGNRLFDVFLEGNQVLNDLDIFDTVGSNTAFIRSFTVDVTDGVLDVTFGAVADNPKIAAIEVSLVVPTPTQIVFTTPSRSVITNQVSEVMTIETQDSEGNAVSVLSNTTIALTTSSVTGELSLNSNPFVQVGSVEIPAGSSSASFYYRDSTAGTPTINASENPEEGLIDAVQQQSVELPPPPPAIIGFTPIEGSISTEVTISGENFIGTTEVSFNGVLTNVFTVDSDSVIRARVPNGATTGLVNVTTPAGSSTSVANFKITPYVQRVNAGDGLYTGVDGREWAADQAYSVGSWGHDGGGPFVRADAINGTADDVLYQSEQHGMSAYRFTVPPGEYRVQLHFAEIFYTSSGRRLFDVSLEGSLVLNDLDIFNVVGHDVALIQNFTTTVTDGVLDIIFTSILDDTKIAAIEVTAVGQPSQLVFTTPSRNAIANRVSEVISFETRDSNDAAVNLISNTTIDLSSSSGTGEFSISANPFVSVSSVVISSGSSSASFYYRDSTVGTPAISVSENPDEGWTDAVQQQAIVPPPPPPTITGFSPTAGSIGTEVIIRGERFSGVTQVSFNGVLVNGFTVDSDTVVRAFVPMDASTGQIGIVTGDGSDLSDDSFEVTPYIQRVNAGGSAQTGIDGRQWSADREYVGGSWGYEGGFIFIRDLEVANTEDDTLYERARFSMSAYRFTVPEAKYRVELHFVETFYNSPGNRLFDVFLEGNQVLNDLDIFNTVGANAALVRAFTVDVTDGVLDVTFGTVVDNPKIAAIEVSLVIPTPTQIVFTTPSRNAFTGQTSEVMTIETQDSEGNPVPVTSNTTIDLTTNSGTGRFSLNINPFLQVGSVVIPAGSSSASFYYRDGTAGTPTINASENPDAGLTDAVQQQTIVAQPPPPVITGFTPTEGSIGTEVTINGENFTGTTEVRFNGVVANEFFVESDLVIRVTVPNGANTGLIRLETSLDTTLSATNFKVTPYIQRVNAGDGLYTGVDGREWAADQAFSVGSWGHDGGGPFVRADAINETADDVLYQSEQHGMSAYRFTVPPGDYRVQLHFAEIFYTSSGRRLFDVSLEGSLVLNDLDIFNAVGHDVALVQNFTSTVSDGVLDITFVSVLDDAKIAAIEVTAIGEPSQLVFTTPSRSITANRISDVLSFETRDANGAVINVSSNKTLDLSSNSGTGEFSLSANPFVPVNSVVIPSGSSSASFHYRDSTVGTPAISVSENPDEGWTDAVQQQTIDPPPPPPAITGFTPTEGSVGTEVTIRGERFTGATQISFNGVLAVGFTVDSDTVARAFVPVDASTGRISIVTRDGTGLSAGNFEVTPYVQRVNAGGGAHTGVDGREWAADREFVDGSWGYDGGFIFIRDFEIANTEDDTLYERARFNMSAYRFTVPAAEYRVELHFVETFYNNPGSRLFDVFLEGNQVLNDLDIFNTVGSNTALVRAFTVDVTDGVLDVTFGTVVDNPKIAAIEVSVVVPTPTQLVFTTPSRSVTTNQVSEVLTIETQDSEGTVIPVLSSTIIEFTSDSGTGEFSLNSSPFTPVGSVVIPAGSSSASFYYRDSSAGNPLISVSENPDAGLTDAAQQQTIELPPPPPTITGFTPTEGFTGTEVDILGLNFTGATEVRFNGVLANGFVVDSDSVIRVNVPAGVSTGLVNVVTAFGNSSSTGNFEVIPYVQRVNAGDGPYTDFDGRLWQADQPFAIGSWGHEGGNTFNGSDAISGTVDDVLYQSEKYGMSRYKFTVPAAGDYRVELHFAEIYYTSSGKRLFDIFLENSLVLNDLDIFNLAGHDGALARSFTTTVTDGVLDIIFSAVVDEPKISAIEVKSVGNPSQLVFTTPARTVIANRVSGTLMVEARDSNNGSVNVISNKTLLLSSTSGLGEFSLNDNPFVPVGSVVIPAGNSSVSFYYRDSSLGNPTISVSENPNEGWTDAVQQQAIIPPPPPPAITEFTPTEGSVGTEVVIRGERFAGATHVRFNGLSANNFTVVSDTVINVTVPFGATTGKLSITTDFGTALSAADFDITELPGPAFVQRVNAGGGAYTGVDGREWAADQEFTAGSWGYQGGFPFVRSDPIAGTADDPLYQLDRFAMTSYRFTVPFMAEYRVELHFAENFYTEANKRVFDVLFEGSLVLNDLDIFNFVGHDVALVRVFSVVVTDGVLDIDFINVIENAKVSAIEVIAVGLPPSISRLVFTNSSRTFNTSQVSDVLTIQTRSSTGLVINVSENTTIDLSTNSASGEFSLASDPFVPVTSVQIPIGSNSANFYYRDSTIGTPTISVAENPDQGWLNASQSQTVVLPPLPPVITDFTPTSGNVGTQVTIRGEHFDDATEVSFNGVAVAEFTVDSDSVIRTNVPVSASTGLIRVVTTGGADVSNDNFEVTSPPEPAFVQRVNAGGSFYNGQDGREWAADQEFTSGSWGYDEGFPYARNDQIGGTVDDVLYQSNRFLLDAYRFTVPFSGDFIVELHFGEIFYNSSNSRVFDVSIEGSDVLNNLDIFASAGHDEALVRSFTVNVTDGVLDITFTNIEDNAMVSAIEVVSVQQTTPLVKLDEDDFVDDSQNVLPETFQLSQNYPNPFNPETSVKLSIPENGQVVAIVFNYLGQEVKRIYEGDMTAGFNVLTWDGTDRFGIPASSGMYFFRVLYNPSPEKMRIETRRMMLLK